MLDREKEYNKIKNFKKEVALPAIARTHAYLRSFNGNPIIQPTTNSWESFATFNPAAVCESGKVHLIYRAIGDKNMSVWGYASGS